MNIKLEGDRYSHVSQEAMDLLKKMLIADPSTRISATEALAHPFFDGMMNSSDQKQNSPCLTKASERKGNLLHMH